MKTDREELARVQSVLDAYRAHAGADDEPPARLDALILGQARSALQKPIKRAPRWPMAMAASFAVASFSGMLFWKMRSNGDFDSTRAVVLQAPAAEQVGVAQPAESDKDDLRQQANEVAVVPPAPAAPTVEVAATSPMLAADAVSAPALFAKPDIRLADKGFAAQAVMPPPVRVPEPTGQAQPQVRVAEVTSNAQVPPKLEPNVAVVGKLAGPAREAPQVLAEQAQPGLSYQEPAERQVARSAPLERARPEQIAGKSEQQRLDSVPAPEPEVMISAAPAPATTQDAAERSGIAAVSDAAPQAGARADDFVPDPARIAKADQPASIKMRDRAALKPSADALNEEIVEVRQLLRDGKTGEARTRWLRFKQRYPNAELPEELRKALR